MSETKRRKGKQEEDKAGQLLQAVEDICKEKNIGRDFILDALEAALMAAYKRNFASAQNVKVNLNRVTGDIAVYAEKTVVEEVDDDNFQQEISLEDAHKISGIYNVGDIVDIEVTPKNFGRVAALTAKQVVTQKIREAERENIYESSSKILNSIAPGRVKHIDDDGRVLVDITVNGDNGIEVVEALMPLKEIPKTEQPPKEHYGPQQRLTCYVSEVKASEKGTQVIVSRTHPGLVRCMFVRDVPEISEGIVEIKSIAREAGSRTKIAVDSPDGSIDPQGACIGKNGIRIQQICDELKGEKIDVVRWSEDPAEYIAAALSPSKVISVDIDEETKTAAVKVPEYQLSLAIGKSGQNVRLAARLTGWKIDITAVNEQE